MKKIVLRSARETKMFAARLAANILKTTSSIKRRAERDKQKQGALVIGLIGDLGAGKTTFVQGFGKALGVKHRMVSPTFLIFRSYPFTIQHSSFHNLYHVDLYRIHRTKELNVLNFKAILHDSNNIVLIEWADRIRETLPKGTIWVTLGHGRKENERTVRINH